MPPGHPPERASARAGVAPDVSCQCLPRTSSQLPARSSAAAASEARARAAPAAAAIPRAIVAIVALAYIVGQLPVVCCNGYRGDPADVERQPMKSVRMFGVARVAAPI